MNTLINLCFLCTKDYNCVCVDSKIVSQVEYLLPEITIFELGVPLRICSVCYEFLSSFSKFKQSSVESSRRLEASIKTAKTLENYDYTHCNNLKDILKETCTINSSEICHKNQSISNTDGATAGPETSETFGDNSENIEQIFIKVEKEELSEQVESNNQELQVHNTFQSTVQTTQSETKKETYIEPIFIKEENVQETNNSAGQNMLQDDKNNSLKLNDNKDCRSDHNTVTVEETITSNSDEETVPKNHSCKICNQSFPHRYKLATHMSHHTGVKDFHCDICQKSFTVKSSLKKHKKTHFGIKDYQCNVCNKSFTQSGTLANHRKIHTGVKDYQCNLCGKTFTKGSTLANHIKTHSGVKDFQCEICDKSFMRKFSLVAHMQIHSGVKDFICEVCSKALTSKANLIRHMKYHSGVKDFHCDVCGKSYTEKRYLAVHMMKHSKEKILLSDEDSETDNE